MHQRQLIRIDRDRALPANSNGPVASSTQNSFHKIYRKKRCYSLAEKEQDRRGSSQWKAGHVVSQRDDNTGIQTNQFSGSSSLKSAWRTDSMQSNNYGNHLVSPSNRESARNYRQHLKRPNDRLRFNSVSGPEFNVPVVKKQKVESYNFSAARCHFSLGRGQDMQKIALEDTKWMYKNQQAKMSGPYGVRQLMEGFYAHFLQEDLPVYQFQDGKLGRQIMLKQLIDELENCSSLIHSPPRQFDESGNEKGFGDVAPSRKVEEDMDLPPGFGGHNALFSERSGSYHRHRSTAFSSSSPDFEVAEFGAPPGFEAVPRRASLTETYVSELGCSRRLSTGAGVWSGWSEGVEEMHSNYEKFEPVVHGRSHSTHQGSSPHSNVSFTMQGANGLSRNLPQPEPVVHSGSHLWQQENCLSARILNESSSRHPSWALTSPNTRISNVEAQSFSSPRVCIGLPVSMAYTQAANNVLPPKESSDFSVMCGVSPLDLIYSELLTAVKRSYANTVLSAVIDEQLKCWAASKDAMGRSSLPEDGSRSIEASSLSSTEFGVMCVEANSLQNGVSTSLPKQRIGFEEPLFQLQAVQSVDGSFLDVHTGLAGVSSEARVAERLDGSGLTDQSVHTEDQKCLSVGTFGTRNAGNTCTALALTDLSSPSQNRLEAINVPLLRKSVETDFGTADPFLSCDEASTKSSKLSGNIAETSRQAVVDQREEMQQQAIDEILQEKGPFAVKVHPSGSTLDAAYLETEPSFLVYGRRKWKIKSLKCLMQSTSEPKPRDTTISTSSVSTKEEVFKGEIKQTLLQNEAPIFEDCDGCARTSVGGLLWRKVGQHAHLKDGSSFHSQSDTPIQMHHRELQTFSAAADACFSPKLTRSEAKLKLARSKIHGWGIFAIEPVEAGDFVIEYVGEVVRPRVSCIRERHYKNLGYGCSFLFHVNGEMVVDATKQGGFARFMNYSCDPNCYSKIVVLGGSKKVFIYAKKRIVSGEELTYDCKFDLEDQKILCNCGSARCRSLQISACI